MEKRFFFYLILSASLFKACIAQFYPAKVYTLEEGMPSYSIYDIAQTPDGVMWFLSSRGIFSYNSVDWKLMDDSLNLPFTASSIIKTADDGTLWVAGKGNEGFVIKYLDGKQWVTVDFNDEQLEIRHFAFNVHSSGAGYKMYLASEGMLHVIDTNTGVETRTIIGEQLDIAIGPTSIYLSNNQIYISTLKGLFQVKDGTVSPSAINRLLAHGNEVLAVTAHENELYLLGDTWIAKSNGEEITYFTTNNGIKRKGNFNKHYILVDPAGKIFFGTGSTPAYFDQEQRTINYLRVNDINFDFFSNKAFSDQEGNIWIASHRGLFKFGLFDFKNYDQNSGLAEHEVSAIFELGDSLVLANSHYLNFLYRGQIEHSVYLDEVPGFRVLDLDADKKGRLYMAAVTGGILRYEKGTVTDLNFLIPDEYSISSVKFFENRIHFSTTNGIYALEEGRAELVIRKRLIRNLEKVGEDTLAAFSTKDGVMLYHQGDTSSFRSENVKFNVTYSAVKWANELLIATSGGVGKVEGKKIVPYDPLSELENAAIYCFLVKEGNLWIGSNLGVYMWNGETLTHLDEHNGLLGIEVNRNGLIKDSAGNIWIGTESGASVYSDKIARSVISDPNFFVEARTSKNGTRILDRTTDLKYDDNTIDFSFIITSYVDEGQTKYRYKLEGFEEAWVDNYKGNEVRYSNLPAGDYTFTVQSNASGLGWNEPVEIGFKIPKAFFAQVWFQLIVLAVILQVGFRIRYKVLIRREANLKKMVDQKTSELEVAIDDLKHTQQRLVQSEKMASLGIMSAGIGHEINNPLNYIANGVHLLQKEIEKESEFAGRKKTNRLVDVINNGVTKVSQIVKSLDQFSKADGSDKESCDIHQILDNCLLFLHKNYLSKIEVVKDYCDEASVPGYTGKLHQVFINILTNAVQAIEGEGQVTILSEIDKDHLLIKISDNGIGISKGDLIHVLDPFFTTKAPGAGTGLGLSIGYSIIKEHDGDLKISSTVGKGTDVIISLPFG